ncbi:ladderlectin-like [Argopecten irradians]|uniref:ladderlectin-like n=1 Tax=Argopecten irradians TaxID=31199 RepID=UPI003723BBE3
MLGFILVLTVFVLQANADCPDGYMKHQGSCYRFHHSEFTWPEAVSFCHAFNAKLLKLESESEFLFVRGKAKESGGSGYWTGGSDAVEDRNWIWSETGSALTLTNDWAPNEPDTAAGRDCLGLYGAGDFKLGAYDCRHLLRPICEVDIEAPAQGIVG